KYRDEGYVWRVSHSPLTDEFKCSCLRMESIGIPCEHIVAILVYLDFVDFPNSLVLNRWSKFAKESIRGNYEDGSHYWDSHLVARHANLVYLSKEVSDLAYIDVDDYRQSLDYLTDELNRLKGKYLEGNGPHNLHVPVEVEDILNPQCSRSKGGGQSANTTTGRPMRPNSCGRCGEGGHNKRSCPALATNGEFPAGSSVPSQSVRLSDDN
ncbi:protein FAR1-RELATED SEQUENCE 5-like, partial [Trifolium medium]|nr:protein FAR1-RELATED SEQUENCE 5-like [Trifolium medium]